ncbi:MAG: hypothetical protein ACLFSD_00015 [Salinivenus sp.]
MGHNFRKTVDDSEQLQYENGRILVVALKGADGEWKVTADRNSLGYYPSKSAARKRMTEWMNRWTERGEDPNAIAADAAGQTLGIDSGGGLFGGGGGLF